MTGPRSESRQRQKLVGVRMTPAEVEALVIYAVRTGRSQASVLRDAFMSEYANVAAADRMLDEHFPAGSWCADARRSVVTAIAGRLEAGEPADVMPGEYGVSEAAVSAIAQWAQKWPGAWA